MKQFTANELKKLYQPPKNSHKGQNGKLLVIGGSKLFHAASLWACEIASKIVDLVFFASVPINLKVMEELKIKGLFRNGIMVPSGKMEDYVKEADCVLIGCGMERQNQKLNIKKTPLPPVAGSVSFAPQNKKYKAKIKNIKDIEKMAKSEGERTRLLTGYLLNKYAKKRWVIDGGALQEMEPGLIPKGAILTPHRKEFTKLFKIPNSKSQIPNKSKIQNPKSKINIKIVSQMAKRYHCVILLKGLMDIVGNENGGVRVIKGGNAGMTKGGTGDVLAGLVAALYCKNEAFLSACAGSLINKTAGDNLYKRVGPYFNASDLLMEIPRVMGRLRQFHLH